MACAVEQATVVLVCFSEKYKDSPNCRTGSYYYYTLIYYYSNFRENENIAIFRKRSAHSLSK